MKIRTLTAAVVATMALAGCSTDAEIDADLGTDLDTQTEATTDDPGDAGDDVAGGTVAFGGIADGDTVTSPVAVSFETDGFAIIPAADGGGDGAGHMHVMIDVGCVAVGEVIPADESHVHFGDGSTSTELVLEPGEHTLCLQAGDGEHKALDVTDEITITVE